MCIRDRCRVGLLVHKACHRAGAATVAALHAVRSGKNQRTVLQRVPHENRQGSCKVLEPHRGVLGFWECHGAVRGSLTTRPRCHGFLRCGCLKLQIPRCAAGRSPALPRSPDFCGAIFRSGKCHGAGRGGLTANAEVTVSYDALNQPTVFFTRCGSVCPVASRTVHRGEKPPK